MNKIYITAAEQISIQHPLSEEWMRDPVIPEEPYVRADDPSFREWLNPIESRRLGILLKRAQTLAAVIAGKTGVTNPDAIMVGTGLGCMENTEKLLNTLCTNGEQMFSPTLFMQSTHNTIASLLAINSKNNGYNITYANKDVSFDIALYDAWMQFILGRINSAIVGGFDELTPAYFTLLERIGYMGGGMKGPGGEAACMVQLSTDAKAALCELLSMRIMYKPELDDIRSMMDKMLTEADLDMNDISAVLTGVNGNEENDSVYSAVIPQLFPSVPTLRYKHLFGTSYTASAYSVYVAAQCLSKGFIPDCLHYGEAECRDIRPKVMVLINQSDRKHYSIIILRAL